MKIASWNINSVRLRQSLVIDLINEAAPDIICLQETKTPDEHFPANTFHDAGYKHIHFTGMKGYNGVAIISKHPFEENQVYHRVGKEDCRHISVKCNGFDLHNIYIPAGGDEPDREINEKFGHKLDFVDEMNAFFQEKYTPKDNVIVVGDFNIAPHEHDVWSHKQLLKVVSHTPIEVEKLNAMQKSLDWIDTARHFVPHEEKSYSWWSYRNRDWKKSNRGRRLDHIWVTQPFKERLKNYDVLSHTRDWEKPSDHATILLEIND